MLEHGIYYEFIPMSEFHGRKSKAINLEKVELGIEYSIVISTNGGLWRYILGDTVKFISLAPYRIEITGRTRHFINVFGEEVIVENTDKALMIACNKTNSEIIDYTVAPVFMKDGKSGAHEWLIEFSKAPEKIQEFAIKLDEELKKLNSDYEAKRFKDMVLRFPVVQNSGVKTFHKWLKSKGKLGGQNKVPRLSNNREILEEILKFKQS
jgi:hypothetical protein